MLLWQSKLLSAVYKTAGETILSRHFSALGSVIKRIKQ